MSKTSNVGDLMARLQQKIEQDRQQIEALTQSELKKLADNLRQSVQDESYIIVRDIKDHTRWMNAALWRPWLGAWWSGCVSFSASCVGSWGLTRWYSNNIQSLIQRRAALTFARSKREPDTARSASGADVGRVAPRGGGRGEVRGASGRDAARQKLALDSARTACAFCYRASEGAL